jgi:hypothetical protein
MQLYRLYAALTLLALSACANDTGRDDLPTPDGVMFEREVYPVLMRDCAFSSCHGEEHRFLRIVGPGRVRLQPALVGPDDPLTVDELLYSYERARSMLVVSGSGPLLLRKPLETEAGGQGHLGTDDFGRNLYRNTMDPSYQVLARWSQTSGLPPTGSSGPPPLAAGAAQVAP